MPERKKRFPDFSAIDPKAVLGDRAHRLETEWLLLAAGDEQNGVGCMTINWGGFGYLWHRPLAMIVVRESRHTLPHILNTNQFSLNAFDAAYRDKLLYCGRVSGKTEDKIAKCGFTPAFQDGVPYFREASETLVCSVMYSGKIDEANFVERKILDEWYSGEKHGSDMHRFFLASIKTVLRKEETPGLE